MRARILISQPTHDRVDGELHAVVAADVRRLAVVLHQPGERDVYILRSHPPTDVDGQALPGKLVEYAQQLDRATGQSNDYEVMSPRGARGGPSR
jgi:hypothetical protein